MIEIRDVNIPELRFTIFCEECELKFSVPVEATFIFKTKIHPRMKQAVSYALKNRMDEFMKTHKGCEREAKYWWEIPELNAIADQALEELKGEKVEVIIKEVERRINERKANEKSNFNIEGRAGPETGISV